MMIDPAHHKGLLRESLYFFLWRSFQTLHPGPDSFVPAWHVEAMCERLERVAAGDLRRLLITVPPRHLKSITTSVAFTAFLLGHRPEMRIMVASYGADLAAKHSRDCRMVMESDWYRDLFPRTRLRSTKELELTTTAGGGRKAVSLGGPATGFGADLLILDDLMKAADARYPAERERVRDYFEQTLYSRLNDKATGSIISIMQRLHEDDITATLQAKGGFDHLDLKAIAKEDEAIPICLGRVHRRRKGEALYPEREPLEVLENTRREIGPAAFAAQYQQNPVPPGGNRLRWEWFGTHDKTIADRHWFQHIVQSWDTALSEDPSSDYCVCTTWGYREAKWYLLDLFRQRLSYSNQKRKVVELKRLWRANTVLIERTATGASLLFELVREDDDYRPYLGRHPTASKEERLEIEAAKLESGNFLVPRQAEWLAAFRQECLAFPSGRYDDQVDSMTQFLSVTGAGLALDFTDRDPRTLRRLGRQRRRSRAQV